MKHDIDLRRHERWLRRRLKEEKAFLRKINHGVIRFQKREPGQILWQDYTHIGALRSKEIVDGLSLIVSEIDDLDTVDSAATDRAIVLPSGQAGLEPG